MADDAGATRFCDIAASCLCGGAYVHAGNVPADGVLQATVTTQYVAFVTGTFGDTTGFSIGDSICVNQSTVGATILVPVRSGDDAAHVVLVPNGETCVPNFAYTVQLDDGGRPLACNAGVQGQLPLTTEQAIGALRATDCQASLGAIDSRWTEDQCVAPGGCRSAGGASPTLGTASALGVIVLALFARRLGLRRQR